MSQPLKIRNVTTSDSSWIAKLMEKSWGGEPLVIRGKKYYPSSMPGIVAEFDKNIAGFLFYEVQNGDCEIIVFEVFEKFRGTGTLLLDNLKKIAKSKNCKRVHLMTTNDALDALRFYQKRGFHICKVYLDSVKASRALKPSIGLTGDYGIPLRDEIDLEFLF